MTWLGDKAKCDGCDLDLGNASLVQCSVLSRIKPGTGDVENLHFCVDREVKGELERGCSSKLLTASKMGAYLARQQEKEAQEPQEAQDGRTTDAAAASKSRGPARTAKGRSRGRSDREVDGDGRRGRSDKKGSGSRG